MVKKWKDDEMSLYFQKQPVELFFKNGVPKDFLNFTGKHLCWSFFLIKFRSKTLLRRDSNIDVFLGNLRNFQKHLV